MNVTKPFDHLVFDLDDTLLDTYRQLVPFASRDACMAMIKAGLDASLEDCLRIWEAHSVDHPRREIFTHLVAHFGVRGDVSREGLAQRGFHAFYNRKVEPHIALFSGAREMLERLAKKYAVHLVTSGSHATQEDKIRILNIRPLFASIHVVDLLRGENKRDAFRAIMQASRAKPERHLSIGNRIDTDIAEARVLGWKACWVRYGEYSGLLPHTEIEAPDFTIENITDLESECRL